MVEQRFAYLYRFIEFDIETRSELRPGKQSNDFVLRGRYEILEIRRETQGQDVRRVHLPKV